MSRAAKSKAHVLLTVTRGMRVLGTFRSVRTPLTNSELVRRSGLPKATVSRLTNTLLQLGVVRHLPGKRAYELSVGRLDFGHAYIPASELLTVAHPFMQKLADQLNVSVALAMRHDLDMFYLGYRASRRVTALRLGVGSVLPMGTTSIGRAYLWGLPDADKSTLLQEVIAAGGDKISELKQDICTSFEELESEGVCAVSSGFQRATYGIALPVTIGRAQRVMALSCGRAEARLDLKKERRRIGPILRAAARQLEDLLADYEGEP